MTQNYFTYNGVTYHTGDIVKVFWYSIYAPTPKVKEAVFVSCDPEKDEYNFKVDEKMYCYTQELFYHMIYQNTEQSNMQNKAHLQGRTFVDELNMDGMLIAWIWYIFIMAIGVIFNDRIVLWIAASIIFFNYRNNKLKNGGKRK
jgi:hypothetical protein